MLLLLGATLTTHTVYLVNEDNLRGRGSHHHTHIHHTLPVPHSHIPLIDRPTLCLTSHHPHVHPSHTLSPSLTDRPTLCLTTHMYTHHTLLLPHSLIVSHSASPVITHMYTHHTLPLPYSLIVPHSPYVHPSHTPSPLLTDHPTLSTCTPITHSLSLTH